MRSRWSLGLVLTDITALLISLCFAVWFRYESGFFASAAPPRYRMLILAGIWITLWVAWSYLLRLFVVPRRWSVRHIYTDITRVLTIHVVSVLLILILLRVGTRSISRPFLYSRSVLICGWLASYWLVVLFRFLFGALHMRLLSEGHGVIPVLLVGPRLAVDQLKENFGRRPGFCYVPDAEVTTTSDMAYRRLEEKIKQVLESRGINHIWLAPDSRSASVLSDLVLSWRESHITWIMAERSFRQLARDMALDESLAEEMDHEVIQERVSQLGRIIQHDIDVTFRIRVAVIGSRGIPASYGGVERYVEELTKRLVANDVDVSVYCRRHYTGLLDSYSGVRLRHVPCINTKHLEAVTHTFLSSLHELFCDDDVVHYQAIGPALFCWIPRVFGRKILVTVQGLDWQRRKWGRFARSILRLGEALSAYIPHATIVVSNDLKKYYRSRYGVDTILIPNGVEIRPTRPVNLIRRYELEGDDYLLCVGRLVPEKGFHTVIEAFRRIKTDKTLVIAGGSSHSDDYAQHLRDLAGDATVLFTGYVYGAVLDELFSNASIFVSASEMEGLPIALLEAMSFGQCPLVSDIEPHREILGEYGLIFPVGDTEELCRLLTSILQTPHHSRKMKHGLQKRVIELFGWDSILRLTLGQYRKCLEE